MNTKTSFVRPVSGDIIPFRVVGYVEWVSGVDKRKIVLHTSLNTFPRINLASDESEGFYADYMQWLLRESGAAKPPQEEAAVPNPPAVPSRSIGELITEAMARSAEQPSGLAKPVTYVVYNHSLECIGKGSTVAEAAERALEACWKCPVEIKGTEFTGAAGTARFVYVRAGRDAPNHVSSNLLHILEV